MRRTSICAAIVASALGVMACGGDDDSDGDGRAGSGGTTDGSGGDGATSGESNGGSGTTAGTGNTSGSGGTGGTAPEPPPASTFACSDLDPELPDGVTDRSCFDFSDGSTTGWAPDGGEWAVSDGAYVGTGPAEAVTCPDTGSLITATVLSDVNAADVRVHAELVGLERADKVLVLRARDSGNRVELNFRSFHDDEGVTYGGDLVIQELVDCALTMHVPESTILVPHELSDVLSVDVELRGDALTVAVNGETVFDDAVPVSTEPGAVGFGVITSAVTRFDDLVVEVLE